MSFVMKTAPFRRWCEMIDQIRIGTSETKEGKRFEQVRIWICGIPFHTDNSEYVERLIRKAAKEWEIEIIDVRN